MSRRVRCVILAEDLRTQRLLRKWAGRIFPPREIHFRDLPAGSRAGDQYVREKYPEEVAEYRHLNKGIRACVLIVHTDADTRTVEHRIHQLDRALSGAGQFPRQPREAVALVIPKRHTETWLYWHAGQETDEVYDCKRDPDGRFPAALKKDVDGLLDPFADFLFAQTRNHAELPPDAPDSFRRAIPELRRLETPA